MYPNIDIEQTGIKLREMIKDAGYDVNDIQEYLQLSCPQSIYRWFKGKVLPSVEHLCALSVLLGVHMENLLVMKQPNLYYGFVKNIPDKSFRRLLTYYKKMHGIIM